MAVTASPESADATLFGKKVSDLQTNVAVGADSITGTLKNVTGYTEFSSKPAEPVRPLPGPEVRRDSD